MKKFDIVLDEQLSIGENIGNKYKHKQYRNINYVFVLKPSGFGLKWMLWYIFVDNSCCLRQILMPSSQQGSIVTYCIFDYTKGRI